MKIISHRGNFDGPGSCKENHPDCITSILALGYDCEIDVRKVKDRFYLGHDYKEYEISKDFLNQKGLWIHCKNLEALHDLVDSQNNVFFHNTDDYTLTNKGIIWAYPGKPVTSKCVLVIGKTELLPESVFGICTDYVTHFKSLLPVVEEVV